MKNITDAMKKQCKGNVTEKRLLVMVYQEINCPHPNSQCQRKHAVGGKEGSTAELHLNMSSKTTNKKSLCQNEHLLLHSGGRLGGKAVVGFDHLHKCQ